MWNIWLLRYVVVPDVNHNQYLGGLSLLFWFSGLFAVKLRSEKWASSKESDNSRKGRLIQWKTLLFTISRTVQRIFRMVLSVPQLRQAKDLTTIPDSTVISIKPPCWVCHSAGQLLGAISSYALAYRTDTNCIKAVSRGKMTNCPPGTCTSDVGKTWWKSYPFGGWGSCP